MYIGEIGKELKPVFYRAGTNISLTYSTDNGTYIFPWKEIFHSAIDAVYSLDSPCYIGAIEIYQVGAGRVELYVDDKRISTKGDGLLPIGQSGKRITVRLFGDLNDIEYRGIDVIGFYQNDGPLLFPQPKNINLGTSSVKLGNIRGNGADAAYAAEFLLDSLKEQFGFEEGDGKTVCFELCSDYSNERYTVTATEDGIYVRAASRLALLWGACRIIELYDKGYIPEIAIDDKPAVEMRGFHMGLPREDRIDFAKKLFRYVLLPLGYNHVIVEFNGNMKYDSHPEIAQKWAEAEINFSAGKQPRAPHAGMGADGTYLEKDQVRELLDVLHGFGIEIIPEVQSLGHVQYLTYAHPELAEREKIDRDNIDERAQDALPSNFYSHCYCPSNENSLKYIFDIIDEVIEVTKPRRYVHIGHDEVLHLALCPICKEKGKAQLFGGHVMALYNYIKSRGLGVMMWSDMLQDGLKYSAETVALRGKLPKDIVMLDFVWYFFVSDDIEDKLLSEGYKVMMGNLYSSHYPRFASRIAKDGMIGGELSTWLAVNELDYAENGKFFDAVYTAEMLWNADRYDERCRTAFNELIGKRILPKMRDLIRGKHALSCVPENTMRVGTFEGDTDRIPAELEAIKLVEPRKPLTVGECYARLIFEHATLYPAPRIVWEPLEEIGKYTVCYEDGDKLDIPVTYGGSIMHWNKMYAQPIPHKYYRHQGYLGTWLSDPIYESRTAEGEPILLLGQVWDNPFPKKIISEIVYNAKDGDYTCLVSAGVLGIKAFKNHKKG